MKGIDTNILVRYILQDDPVQGQQAVNLINQTQAIGESILINNIVLCELVWVLESAYDYKKDAVANVLEQLLKAKLFTFENKSAVELAWEEYQNSKADFSDCLLGIINQIMGCSETLSFDKGIRGVTGFNWLK